MGVQPRAMLDQKKKLFMGIVAVFVVCELVLINTNDALFFERASYLNAFSAAAGGNRRWFSDFFGAGNSIEGSASAAGGDVDKDMEGVLYPAELKLDALNMYAGDYVEKVNKAERVFRAIRRRRKKVMIKKTTSRLLLVVTNVHCDINKIKNHHIL